MFNSVNSNLKDGHVSISAYQIVCEQKYFVPKFTKQHAQMFMDGTKIAFMNKYAQHDLTSRMLNSSVFNSEILNNGYNKDYNGIRLMPYSAKATASYLSIVTQIATSGRFRYLIGAVERKA